MNAGHFATQGRVKGVAAASNHPELMDGSDTPEPTVATLANSLSGQLNDATGKVAGMLGRLRGIQPEPGDDIRKPTAESILGTLAGNCDQAAGLLNLLCELESRIGG